MNKEKQMCSLELSKKLKELGVKQESLFWWTEIMENYKWTGKYKLEYEIPDYQRDIRAYSAFTVAELGEMLKNSHIDIDYWYSYPDFRLKLAEHNTSDGRNELESNARAEMLIYLLENKLLTQ